MAPGKKEARIAKGETNGDAFSQTAEKWRQPDLSSDQSRGRSRAAPTRADSTLVKLRLSNMPKSITVQQLWTVFSSKGLIQALEIFDDLPGDKMAMGQVVFKPPPKDSFWDDRRFTFTIPGQTQPTTIYVGLLECLQKSPVRQHSNYYPTIISVALESLDFGSLFKGNTMAIAETVTPTDTSEETTLEFNSRSGRFTIYFSYNEKQRYFSRRRQYKLVVQIASLKIGWDTGSNENQRAISLQFHGPIEYFWKVPDVTNAMAQGAKKWHIEDAWVRATDIYEDLIEPQKQPVSTYSRSQHGRCIDISRLKMFRCVINQKDMESLAATDYLLRALQDHGIRISSEPLNLVINKSSMWDTLDNQNTSSSNALESLDFAKRHISLDFAVRYRLEVCVSRGFISEYAVDDVFLEKLAALEVSQATGILEHIVDQELNIQDPLQIFEDAQFSSIPEKRRIPHYCSLVFKVNVTPTALKLNLPNVESSNRVTRRYNHLQDRFLRVQFLGETEAERIARDRYNNEDIWKRLLRALHKGIRIGDRTFEFLAFGNSQLREASVTFFCETPFITCNDIRKWLGNFSHIRNIAKFGARIGQCFSTTREIRGVRVPTIRHIDEIEANGECFSDGVGIISDLLAHLVFDEMKLDVVGEPSAFQFRMGGAKGVLAVWPSEYAKKMEVCLRKSQIKFSSEANTLEIIKCARCTTATLNRQTIVILEHLGVPTSSFMDLLESQIQEYEQAMTNRTVAIDLLTRFIDENQSTVVVAELLKAGFRDPFVTNLIKLWGAWSLKLIKEKSKLHVEKSAYVMGCIDETGTLRGHLKATEGKNSKAVSHLPQIFLQLSDRKYRNKTRIITGVCIIGRNPSLHAGDIRVVEAVDNPKLAHLKDVVVFPSTGDRSVPSMLSGGDLDGDDYFVIWEPSLLPKVWNTPPMHSTPVKPQDLDRDVQVNDLRNFVVKYMKNDFLPLIATAHLAYADSERDGVNSRICLQLAEMHSQAVDYPKTGIPAEWSREKYSPKRWPHFMAKSRSYLSRRALGKLFDRVASANIDYVPSCEDEFDERIAGRFEFNDDAVYRARNLKTQYDIAVRRLLKQYRVGSEFELYTGWAMTKPVVGSDYKRQEDLGQQFETLKHRFRELCVEAAGEIQLDRFVAAMYKATADEVKTFLGEVDGEGVAYLMKDMPLISFPWIFHWILVRIAMGDKFKPHESALGPAAGPMPMGQSGTSIRSKSHGESSGESMAGESERRDLGVVNGEPWLIDLDVEPSKTGPESAPMTENAASVHDDDVRVSAVTPSVETTAVEIEEMANDALAIKPAEEALTARPADDTVTERPIDDVLAAKPSDYEMMLAADEVEKEVRHLTVKKTAADRLLELMESDSD